MTEDRNKKMDYKSDSYQVLWYTTALGNTKEELEKLLPDHGNSDANARKGTGKE